METTAPIHSQSTIYLVDDHPLVRDWLSRLINEESDLKVSGGTDKVDAAIREIQLLKPNLIIIDIGLRGRSGLELIRFLKDQNPDELILVLSTHDEAVYAHRALKAGARGYVNKRETTEKVIQAIRRILSGGMYISESLAESLATGLSQNKHPGWAGDVNLLSNRELEVFRLLATGRETSEIAKDLSVSLKTVQSYCARIKEKLGLHNATELLQAATRWLDGQNTG
ncbi:MAG: response regulator transcription factor [Methylacidiphilales bacterium]|nr:response regulator transcription factor [Candidatus Methylacidiphilales bacterium]